MTTEGRDLFTDDECAVSGKDGGIYDRNTIVEYFWDFEKSWRMAVRGVGVISG